MPATLTVNQSWTDGKRLHVVGIISLAGNYVTGGIPLSLEVYGIPTSQPIVHSDITGKGGYYTNNVGTLYQYRYLPAPYTSSPTSPNPLANGLLRIYDGATELSATTIPAGVLSDTIFFYGIFQKY